MTTSDKLKNASPIILRIGIALVFLWFGFQELLHTDMWVRLIPQWVLSTTGLSAVTMVHFNGAFEIVFGLALLLGFFTRTVALLLALHIISIALDVGYGAIGVRDFGLSMATIAIFLHGVDCWSLDRWFEKKGNKSSPIQSSTSIS